MEGVKADCATNKLTVDGKVDAGAIKEKLEEKTKKKVEILTPQAKKEGGGGGGGGGGDKKKADDKKPKAEEKKPEEQKPKEVTTNTQWSYDSIVSKLLIVVSIGIQIIENFLNSVTCLLLLLNR